MLIKFKTDIESKKFIKSLNKEQIHYEIYQDDNETFVYTNADIDIPSNIKVINRICRPIVNQKKNITISNTIVFSENEFRIIAGPCTVDDEKSLRATAELLKKNGIKIIRGGVNKLRTSPYSFQGYGIKAAKLLNRVAQDNELFTTTEITEINEIDYLYKYIDIFLVGTRNMFNYQLLKELSKQDKPIILKRGMSATVKEWLLAAEYLTQNGKRDILLCERGIRTFNDCLRNTFDLAAAIYVNQNTSYLVITDPSHATGINRLVEPLVLASKAAGLHGAMVEIHPFPKKSLSDSEQLLDFNMFDNMMKKIL